jgi:hypothetical protein
MLSIHSVGVHNFDFSPMSMPVTFTMYTFTIVFNYYRSIVQVTLQC